MEPFDARMPSHRELKTSMVPNESCDGFPPA